MRVGVQDLRDRFAPVGQVTFLFFTRAGRNADTALAHAEIGPVVAWNHRAVDLDDADLRCEMVLGRKAVALPAGHCGHAIGRRSLLPGRKAPIRAAENTDRVRITTSDFLVRQNRCQCGGRAQAIFVGTGHHPAIRHAQIERNQDDQACRGQRNSASDARHEPPRKAADQSRLRESDQHIGRRAPDIQRAKRGISRRASEPTGPPRSRDPDCNRARQADRRNRQEDAAKAARLARVEAVPADCREHAQAQGCHHQQFRRVAEIDVAGQSDRHQPVQTAERGPDWRRPGPAAPEVDLHPPPAHAVPAKAGQHGQYHGPGKPGFAGRRPAETHRPKGEHHRYQAHVERRRPGPAFSREDIEPAAMDGKGPAADVGPQKLSQPPRSDAEVERMPMMRGGLGPAASERIPPVSRRASVGDAPAQFPEAARRRRLRTIAEPAELRRRQYLHSRQQKGGQRRGRQQHRPPAQQAPGAERPG